MKKSFIKIQDEKNGAILELSFAGLKEHKHGFSIFESVTFNPPESGILHGRVPLHFGSNPLRLEY